MNNILIIDDEPTILATLSLALEDDFNIYTAEIPSKGFSIINLHDIDLVLLDQYLGKYSGFDVLKEIKENFPSIIVITMTAHSNIDSSIKAIEMGAYYYIAKPLDIKSLKVLLTKALDYRNLSLQVEQLKRTLTYEKSDFKVISKSKVMDNIFELIEKVKDLDINILITGESGTGKDMIAKAIHYSSSRRNEPLEAINCAAIPFNLLESELFGYEKGAFTGATSKYNGKFSLANKGTLFLDEIGELDITLQAKLLRVLQDKKITPLGSEESTPVDFRLIVATNNDLSEKVLNNSFREDLYFRLNVVNIHIPPLRDRIEDIPELVSLFIDKYNKKFNRNIENISFEAISVLESYNYPGNVRELENIIERAVALTSKKTINVRDLPNNILSNSNFIKDKDWIAITLGLTLETVIQEYIVATYEIAGRNKRKTASILNISERNLYNKLNKTLSAKE